MSKSQKAINSIISNNNTGKMSSKAAAKAATSAQSTRKLKAGLLAFAGINSTVNAVHQHKWKTATAKQERLDEAFRNASRHPGGPAGGRSVEEIMLEQEMKRHKKKMEKMAQKWPNLKNPQSFSQKVQMAFNTGKRGISESLRAQTMKGVSEAQTGTDTRALAAANLGFVPDSINNTDDYSL